MGRWLTLIGLHQNRLSACKTGKRMPKDHSVSDETCRPPPGGHRGMMPAGRRLSGSACRSPGRASLPGGQLRLAGQAMPVQVQVQDGSPASL